MRSPCIHIGALAALVGMAAAGAFQIPSGLSDGVYVVDMDSDSVNLIQPINSTNPPPSVSMRGLQGRGIPVTKTGCDGGKLNTIDYLKAYSYFFDFCDSGKKIQGRRIAYSIVGSAVWYGCSYGGENPCGGQELSEAEAIFNRDCGILSPGWLWSEPWAKTYGRANSVDGICENLGKNKKTKINKN